jgi:hypothetical protein
VRGVAKNNARYGIHISPGFLVFKTIKRWSQQAMLWRTTMSRARFGAGTIEAEAKQEYFNGR